MGKCFRLSVTRVRPWARATAAIVTSGRAIVCPFFAHSLFSSPARRDLPGHFVEFEAPQKRLCRLGFAGPHTRIHLGHVDGATGEKLRCSSNSSRSWLRPRLPLMASTMTLV